MAHEDWDLFAIVRSCQAATFTATTTTETPPTTTATSITRSPQDTTTSCLATFVANQENGPFSFPNLVQPRPNGFQELHQLFMTFNPTTTTTTTTSGNSINPNSPFSDFAGSIGQQQRHYHPVLAPSSSYTSIGASTSGFDRFHHHQQQHVHQPQPQEEEEQQQQQHNQLHVQLPQTCSMVLPNTQLQTPRSRKRKSQQKKIVCHVTADNLSSDLWAWRKYGQKPIKGSPYPRNYYRCSSCKGCAARKQVERSTTEPTMFIVTYTGEHKHAKPSHRNSLAGSTRNKPSTTRLPANRETRSPSSVSNANSLSIAVVSPTQQVTSQLVNDDEDPVSTGESEEAGREPKPDMGSDEDDVLIPNSMVMSEPVFLGLHHFDGVCSKTADNSDPNSVPGLAPPCFKPASNNNRPNPG